MKNTDFIKTIFYLLASTIAGLIILSLASLLFHDTQNINNIRIIQTLQTLLVFIIPPFIVGATSKESTLGFLSFNKIKVEKIILAMVSMITITPFINQCIIWNQNIILPESMHNAEIWMKSMENSANEMTELILGKATISNFIINMFIVALLAGFGEELFFRGTIQKILTVKFKKHPHLMIWITAIIFSAIHMQFYGFIPRMILGAWLGYLLFWTKSIWVPMAAHFTNNAMSVAAYYISKKAYPDINIENINAQAVSSSWILTASSIIITALIAVKLIRKR